MYIIDKSTEDQQVFSRRIPFAALRELLTDAEVETICKQLGHTWRERKLPPAIITLSGDTLPISSGGKELNQIISFTNSSMDQKLVSCLCPL